MVLASSAIMEGLKAARAFHSIGHADHASACGTISVVGARARWVRVRGHLSDKEMAALDEALRIVFGL